MLSRTVEHYLEMRRATGFRMRVAGYLLRSFTRFAAKRRESHVCTRTAIEWASLAPSERQRANRLGTLRMFARFARAEDPRHEVPPPRVFAAPRIRYAPFILSQEQVAELIRRAAQLKTDHWPLRQWTFCTLFSLLAVTGMRISEALALVLKDITVDGLLIREAKFRKSRLLPLHPTASDGLARYLERRGALADNHVFVSVRETALPYSTVIATFLRLVRQMGIHPGPGHRGPRIHDLRHGFALRVLEGCPNLSNAVDARMLALSTYMGHARLDSTYWYLHATPHLLHRISDACEQSFETAVKR
jgi:integrase/recombinase XerD